MGARSVMVCAAVLAVRPRFLYCIERICQVTFQLSSLSTRTPNFEAEIPRNLLYVIKTSITPGLVRAF